ncbi:putative cation-transporting atpase 4 protein [Neofusicoccum parvum UCRNP2]|uniref:Putative cation-transporting atpase 4 protein n=1 Tax=Botryosphaeria parva (strain UCR-NP2) TaxID=1287680 RepID=R1GKC3_BOTPV|nr:putative cation-transporting atpase 4 protein [Neofusicoccum parvum UCRNP2]
MAITPTGPALTLELVSIVLLVFSVVTVAARVVVRRTIKALGSDDWLMIIGLVFYTLACQATITAALNGVGTHADYLDEHYDHEGRKWFMMFQIFYVASTVPIKSAICVALLRITQERKYRYPLWGIMLLATIAAIVTIVAVLAQCHPISATWDKSLGTCIDPSVITNVSYFISSVSIVTDWSCAILPVFILWNVQLRFRIKASVAAILALGVVASTATLVRLRYLLNYGNPDDYLYGIANIALWSIIESGTGIIAGSLPSLRPLLRYVPFFGESFAGSSNKRSGMGGGAGGRSTSARRSHKLDTYRLESGNGGGSGGMKGFVQTACEAGKRNWEELSDAESQKYILKESHVTVTNEAVGDDAHRSHVVYAQKLLDAK